MGRLRRSLRGEAEGDDDRVRGSVYTPSIPSLQYECAIKDDGCIQYLRPKASMCNTILFMDELISAA